MFVLGLGWVKSCVGVCGVGVVGVEAGQTDFVFGQAADERGDEKNDDNDAGIGEEGPAPGADAFGSAEGEYSVDDGEGGAKDAESDSRGEGAVAEGQEGGAHGEHDYDECAGVSEDEAQA